MLNKRAKSCMIYARDVCYIKLHSYLGSEKLNEIIKERDKVFKKINQQSCNRTVNVDVTRIIT